MISDVNISVGSKEDTLFCVDKMCVCVCVCVWCVCVCVWFALICCLSLGQC